MASPEFPIWGVSWSSPHPLLTHSRSKSQPYAPPVIDPVLLEQSRGESSFQPFGHLQFRSHCSSRNLSVNNPIYSSHKDSELAFYYKTANHRDLLDTGNAAYGDLYDAYNKLNAANKQLDANYQALRSDMKQVIQQLASSSVALSTYACPSAASTLPKPKRDDYSDIKFWRQRDFTAFCEDKKKSGAIVDPTCDLSRRGGARLAQTGENVATEYIEDENGSPVDGTTADDWKTDYLISRVLSQWNTNKKRREKKSQSAKARPNDSDFEETIRPVGEGDPGGSNFAMENLDDCHSEVINMDENTRNGSKKCFHPMKESMAPNTQQDGADKTKTHKQADKTKSATGMRRVTNTNSAKNLFYIEYLKTHDPVMPATFECVWKALGKEEIKKWTVLSKSMREMSNQGTSNTRED
ncbi:hypothetical protein BU17DRAFT_61781 [Hysterangium stoloniferum]|nr:hypothetical protein BU17DRAFT_61781 [Hysterangium stoloniferum]